MSEHPQTVTPSGAGFPPPGARGIDPVPAGTSRPFWSVMIPTYNFTRYLPQTLESLLAQDPGPAEMQIAVVDDCSTKDDPAPVLESLGVAKRVQLVRLAKHVSISEAWNACLDRATGYWVHILHSDDLVLPGFYARLREAVELHAEAGVAFCRAINIDADGNWISIPQMQSRTAGFLANWMERIVVDQRMQCPASVVKREVYERLGGYHSELRYALDWEMWKRISLFYPVWYDPQPLACYRVHSSSTTAGLMRDQATIADVRKSIEITRGYLPAGQADALSRKALELCALTAMRFAKEAFLRGGFAAGCQQIRQAFRSSRAWRVLDALVSLALWYAMYLIKQPVKRLLRTGPVPGSE